MFVGLKVFKAEFCTPKVLLLACYIELTQKVLLNCTSVLASAFTEL